jgi:hypothetical protein
MLRIRSLFLLGSLSIAVAAACGSSNGSNFDNGKGSNDGGSNPIGSSGSIGSSGGNDDGGGNTVGQPITIEPTDQTLLVTVGETPPTLQFTAKIAATGQVIPASWSIDRGEIGSISLTGGLFTPSGTFGGTAKITATYQGQTAQTTVTVKLKMFENGGVNVDAGSSGAGGNGGVGGDGTGGSVASTVVDVLHGTPIADAGLSLLYPYDATVWPRGILAPLLMWNVGAAGDYDAIDIKLASKSFDYEGVYGKNAAPFKNHPISQAAWSTMLSSNQGVGDDVDVTITFAKGTQAYGPLHVKWTVASAPLKGIVYYNSYGTKLAQNFDGALNGTPTPGRFGGATLGVHGGSTDPVLVAGASGDATQCRVCHSVAADGSLLITQREGADLREFSTYDLKQAYPNGETPMTPTGLDSNKIVLAPYAWSAIYPDGSLFLNDSSDAAGSTGTGAGQPGNSLWKTVSGTAPAQPQKIDTIGWPDGLRAAYPAFSPDGKGLAFTMYTGSSGTGALDKRTLGYMTFDKSVNSWGPMMALFTPDQPAGQSAQTALYPAFLPTNDSVVFEVETEYNGRDYGGTRSRQDTNGYPKNDVTQPADPTLVYNRDHGAHGELWIVPANGKGKPVRLDKLNGKGYIPVSAPGTGNYHEDRTSEETLDYEPTVNPVPSGGYAWVVFTSRRLYGNVATQNPFWSDPRFHDLTKNPTPKKLWVAAIDLNAPPGSDPSHPAFYLPAQELLAGNSRGYWVVDPCKADGNGCASGDECCGGFCRPDQATQKLTCSNVVPVCAQEYEKCTTSADCCNNPDYQCINNRCAVPAPK